MKISQLKSLHTLVPTIDSIGIAASSLCLIHCMAMPFLLLFLPALIAPWVHNDMTHKILALFVVSACLTGLLPGYLRHKDKSLLLFMTVGLGLVLWATLSDLCHTNMEMPVITVGNILLIVGHWRNRKAELCCAEIHDFSQQTVQITPVNDAYNSSYPEYVEVG